MGLYENVKRIAEQKGLTVSKLEKELGFSRSSIAKFNSNSPSIDKIKAISDFLGVKIDDIVNFEISKKDFQEESDNIFFELNVMRHYLKDAGWEVSEPHSENAPYLLSKGSLVLKISIDDYLNLIDEIKMICEVEIQNRLSSIINSALLPVAARPIDGAPLEGQMEDAQMVDKDD